MIVIEGGEVICIKKGNGEFITIGKIYEVLGITIDGDYYLILCDDETYAYYSVDKFTSLSDWREQQINKVL